MPGVSVSNTIFSAWSWAATPAAAVSALTLSQPPSASSASDGMTGTTPAAQKSRIKSTSTRVTLPTRPRSIGSPSAPGNRSFSPMQVLERTQMRPDGPAAQGANLLLDAGVDFLEQHLHDDGQRFVVGIAAALDFARLQPACAMARSIGLPPPCTSTGRMPTVSMKTTSWSVAAGRPGLPWRCRPA